MTMLQRPSYLMQLLAVVLFLIPPMATMLLVVRQFPAARESNLDGTVTPAAVRRAVNSFPARLR
jgi:hypothetical protein